MSLTHWWPLDGDNYDKIAGGVLSGITPYQEGKLGRCSYNNSQLLADFTLEELDGLNKDFSMGCWIKINKQEILSHFSTISSSATVPTGSILGYNHYGGISLTWSADGLSSFNNISVRGSLRGTSPSYVFGGTYNLPFDKWVHLMLVKDTKNQQLILYVDGIQKASDSITVINSITNTTQNFGINRPSVYSGNGPQTTLPMRISDVRVYDHALSVNEIKELSKALMVHYTFNDTLTEPTVNLLPIAQQTQSNTAATIEVTEGLVDGATYTLSTYVTRDPACTSTNPRLTLRFFYSDGTNTAVSKYHDGGASYPKDGNERYYYITATANSQKTLTKVGGWLLDHSSGSGKKMTATRSQLEIKDHPTPYTPSSREAMVIDESGYNHSTALYNNCELTTDTGSGSLALHTAGLPDRIAHDSCSYLKGDIGTLITPTEFTICFNAKVNQWGVQTSGILSLNADSPEPTGYLTSTFVQYDSNFRLNNSASTAQASIGYGIITVGEWHHYAFVWDGSTLIGYRDGVQYGTPVAAAFTPDPFRYIYLGYDRAGGAGRDADVTWGDFRLYTTALDADEVLDLAKTKAYVTNKGDIETNEFVENQVAAQVTKNSVFETQEIYEELLPAEYEQLEYIEFDYVQGSSEPYINTGYNTTGIYQIDCDIEVKAAVSNYQFGQQQKGGWMYNGFYSTGSLEFNWAALTPRPTPTARHIMTQTLSDDETQIVIAIDGVTWTTNPGTNGQGGDFYIFACRNGSNVFRHYGAGMRLYSFRIHEGYRTVREFIPAKRKSDSVIGLYDAATRELYVNAGTGSFIGGPVVKNDEAMIYENGNISGREIIEV